jgi:uncharacterized membrane protein
MPKYKPVTHFIKTMFQGLFWLLPIVTILIIISWLYGKIALMVDKIFSTIGFTPNGHIFLWSLIVLFTFAFILYLLGWFVKTRVADLFDYLFCKIPGYSTLKGLIGIFNSSKKGNNQVLVVAIKGFATEGYNIGLMYSQKESIIKDHYTVTLSMSPIPNGGFMFEVPKQNIYVLENATFDDNLQYLLSMGIKSFSDIINTKPKNLDEFLNIEEWLKENKNSAYLTKRENYDKK